MNIKRIFLVVGLTVFSLGSMFGVRYETRIIKSQDREEGQLYVLLVVDEGLCLQDLINRNYTVQHIVTAYNNLGEDMIVSQLLIEEIKGVIEQIQDKEEDL